MLFYSRDVHFFFLLLHAKTRPGEYTYAKREREREMEGRGARFRNFVWPARTSSLERDLSDVPHDCRGGEGLPEREEGLGPVGEKATRTRNSEDPEATRRRERRNPASLLAR